MGVAVGRSSVSSRRRFNMQNGSFESGRERENEPKIVVDLVRDGPVNPYGSKSTQAGESTQACMKARYQVAWASNFCSSDHAASNPSIEIVSAFRCTCGNTKGYSSTYLAMGFANARVGTRVLACRITNENGTNSVARPREESSPRATGGGDTGGVRPPLSG